MLTTIEPDWLPDETLYSLCARIRRLSCSTNSSNITRMLFGAPRAGSQHDFPTALRALVLRSEGRWGTVDELIDRHTVLPYFLPLRTPEVAANAYSAMAGKAQGMLKYQLGLLTSRFRAHHPLKACPQCMAQDRILHNVAYWHLSHQYPSAWVCQEHDLLLIESTIKATGVRRFDWCLPDEGEFRGPQLLRPRNVDLSMRMRRLAVDSTNLARLPRGFHFDPVALSETYRRRARIRGYAHTRWLAWRSMSADYLAYIAPLPLIEAFRGLPDNFAQSRAELERLLRTPRAGTHPIRHLALTSWLFADWSDFLSAYADVAASPEPYGSPATTAAPQVIDNRITTLIALVQTEGVSLSQGARRIGVDTKTAMAWAAQSGIAVSRRSKVLKPELRSRLESALRDGVDKVSAGQIFGVSVTTVTTTLRTTPGLHLAWQTARARRTRDERRQKWKTLVAENTEAGSTTLRCLAPNCYAWLYRNDRAWLDEINSGLPSKRAGNHSRVAWDERDRSLAAEVEQLGNKLSTQFDGKTIPLSLLCQQLPELKAKIGSLDRLPLTKRALSILTRRRVGRSPRLL